MDNPNRATRPVSFPSVTDPDQADYEWWRARLLSSSDPAAYVAGYLCTYVGSLASSGTIYDYSLRKALAAVTAWDEISRDRLATKPAPTVLPPDVPTGTAGLEPRQDVALTDRCGHGSPFDRSVCWQPATQNVRGWLRCDRHAGSLAPDVTEGPEIVAADGSVA